jgi:putative DNA primase/helicase
MGPRKGGCKGRARNPEHLEENQHRNCAVARSPLNSAREWLKLNFIVDEGRTLQHQQSTFYHWIGASYIETPTESLRSGCYAFLDKALVPSDDSLAPFHPNQKSVSNVMDAMAAVTQLPVKTMAPTWLDDAKHAEPSEVLAFTNGLLHLPTRRVRPHTPLFFNLNAVDYAYDPNAGAEPKQWLDFLNTLWKGDQQSIDTLQELFGLLLTTNTSLQKAFLMVGPKRSGKGTIARILSAMLGRANVVGPTLSSLGDRFGLAPLIGKPLAIVSDARLGGRTDVSIIAERILSISGEDTITIDRKNRDCWNGTLPTRFLILTNELPRLTDASGALTSRFIVLRLTLSFFGQEDTGLTNRLLGELTAILNWALDGYDRLRERGYFEQPETALSAIQQMEDMGSPISAFVRECCDIGAFSIEVDDLFNAWAAWCRDQNRDHVGTKQTFCKDIRAAVPTLDGGQARTGAEAKLKRFYQGIALKKASQ